LWVSLFGTEFFVIHLLTSVLVISWEKLNPPNSQRCLTHFHPTPLTWETWFHPNRVIRGSLGVISLPFCLLRQAWIRMWVITSLISGAPLSSLVPASHRVPLCIRDPYPDSSGGWILLWIILSIGTWWDLLPVVGGHNPVTREVITHHVSAIPDESPRNVVGSC
jgi:hypothetical protein